MDDAKVIQTRNGLLISFALLVLLVMWGNVLGISGMLIWGVHLLALINLGGLIHFVRMTGFDSLTTSKLPLVLIGLLAAASIVRFVYAMSYGD